MTTTYTNDVFGLTQVLVADDGTAQVTNLFGLDLISQDSGSEVRTLLVDGLGSVRMEMVGNVVETATTYSPYGEVLTQSGTSGTVYGFTGEQEDAATGLLYLRAHYYSPALKVFQSRDPWEGTGWKPNTLNYYVYGLNSPVVYTDPSGHVPQRGRMPSCPVGRWDCEAVRNVHALRRAFIDSAARHNRLPSMDNNGFAALIAATIVSERRIGNVPPPGNPRDRYSQWLENRAADWGCIVSGFYIWTLSIWLTRRGSKIS